MTETSYSLFTDGGARGNPGPSACAALLFDPAGQLVAFDGCYLNSTTNNMAEYKGLLAGLKLAHKHGVTDLKVHMDSELIVMQMNGAYRVKEKSLKEQWELAKQLRDQIAAVKFIHVRREKNHFADKLVNLLLDAAQ